MAKDEVVTVGREKPGVAPFAAMIAPNTKSSSLLLFNHTNVGTRGVCLAFAAMICRGTSPQLRKTDPGDDMTLAAVVVPKARTPRRAIEPPSVQTMATRPPEPLRPGVCAPSRMPLIPPSAVTSAPAEALRVEARMKTDPPDPPPPGAVPV